LRDWCISRQIWFGHRIPVWYCRAQDKEQCQLGCKNPIVSVETPINCPVCGSADLVQDPDTLDTWFSSGLWTFSTLGWPNINAKDFKNYHPTNLLETGYDILFFWVARMILMTTYLLNDIPFKTVYLHGLVRDKDGRKMSKSLDNIVDPLDIIGKYGADTLRMSLVIGSTPGNDIRLYDEKIKTFRNFTNKLWNIGRYVNNFKFQISNFKKLDARNPSDHWILSRLQEITKEVTRLLENYQVSLAGEKLRDFTWNEFADWYVEIHKIEKNNGVLIYVFETLLKLWHPFMPFVTEAIYQTSHPDTEKFLMTERWPDNISVEIKPDEARGAHRFQCIISIIQEIRALRSFYKIDSAKYISVTVKEGANEWALIRDNGDIFKRLARVSDIHIIRLTETPPQKSVRVSSGLLDAYIELESLIDFDTERKRLEKEKTEKEKYIATLETKLGNKNFMERANPEIVQAEQMRLEEAKKQLDDLKHHIALLK
jgi:valyl-tRNA synthetase